MANAFTIEDNDGDFLSLYTNDDGSVIIRIVDCGVTYFSPDDAVKIADALYKAVGRDPSPPQPPLPPAPDVAPDKRALVKAWLDVADEAWQRAREELGV